MLSSGDLEIFNITSRLRSDVFETVAGIECDDAELSRAMSAKSLKYILRIGLASGIYYKRSEFTAEEESKMRIGKRTISRLLRNVDFFQILPRDTPSVIRNSLKILLAPYIPQSTYEKTLALRQVGTIKDLLKLYPYRYAMYLSSWGVNETVSLPVVSLVLEKSDMNVEERINSMYDPYCYETLPVRFAMGQVKNLGRTFYYSRVPMGASISPDEEYIIPSTVGSLGVYVRDEADSESTYALTAGHVAREVNPNHDNVLLYAPASLPYSEAKKSALVAVTRALKRDDVKRLKENEVKLEALTTLDRHFGSILFATMETSTSPPYLKYDVSLLRVRDSRAADNCLSKIPAYPFHFEKGADIPNAVMAPDPGSAVCKVGLRTGFTSGIIGNPGIVRWDPVQSNMVSADESGYDSLPESMVHLIFSDEFESFADEGDSGSLVVHVDSEEGEPVTRSRAVGLVTHLIRENPPEESVVFFLPMKEALERVSEEMGKRFVIDDRTREETEWIYEEMGEGRSMWDLR
jgi:hypothetical protein